MDRGWLGNRPSRPATAPPTDTVWTVEPNPAAAAATGAVAADSDPLREIVAMLREVTGEDEAWASRVNPATLLDQDLLLESFEVADLHERMRARFDVDLLGFLANRDLDGILELRVADLVGLAVDR